MMEGFARKETVMVLLMMMMGMAGWKTCAEARLITVGGSKGWTQNVNYTQWSTALDHIYVGDWLYFIFDKHYYNVLEVNKTSYESCNDQGFIKNITKGGRDVLELTETRPYYFMSSGGYCYQGMKVAVNVEEKLAPAPSPAKNGSPSNTPTRIILPILISIAFALPILFKPY